MSARRLDIEQMWTIIGRPLVIHYYGVLKEQGPNPELFLPRLAVEVGKTVAEARIKNCPLQSKPVCGYRATVNPRNGKVLVYYRKKDITRLDPIEGWV